MRNTRSYHSLNKSMTWWAETLAPWLPNLWQPEHQFFPPAGALLTGRSSWDSELETLDIQTRARTGPVTGTLVGVEVKGTRRLAGS